jgi:sulfate transporter 4
MGVTFLIILFAFKWAGGRYKKLGLLRALGPLTVTILGIAIVNIFNLECNTSKTSKDRICYTHIRVVGHIPKGLPGETVSWWFPIPNFGKKMGYAVIICLVDVLESVSIAKALAFKNHYELIPGRELRGLGIANLFGAAFNCYTTTGSFSRSAVMDQTGAKTQMAAWVQAIVVGFTLLVLTPVFTNMPQNAQGAIIISAVVGLFNYTEFFYLWKINKLDWLVFNAAWFGVMFAGVEIGLAIAVGVSILLVLYKTGFPHMAVLGRLPGTTVYRNIKQYPEAKQPDNGLLVIRIDSPIYFANVTTIRDSLQRYELRLEKSLAERGRKLEFIIIDMSPVSDIDASAVHFLTDWIDDHKRRGIQTVFANPSRQVIQLFERAGIPKKVGEEFILVRTHDAVTYCQEILVERGQLGDSKLPLGKPSPGSASDNV